MRFLFGVSNCRKRPYWRGVGLGSPADTRRGLWDRDPPELERLKVSPDRTSEHSVHTDAFVRNRSRSSSGIIAHPRTKRKRGGHGCWPEPADGARDALATPCWKIGASLAVFEPADRERTRPRACIAVIPPSLSRPRLLPSRISRVPSVSLPDVRARGPLLSLRRPTRARMCACVTVNCRR